MNAEVKSQLAGLQSQIEGQRNPETRATTTIREVAQLYARATAAQDWDMVRALNVELERAAVSLGQAIGAERTQQAGG